MASIYPRPEFIPEPRSTGLTWFDKLQQAMNTTPTPIAGLQGPGTSGMQALLRMLAAQSSREGGQLPFRYATSGPVRVRAPFLEHPAYNLPAPAARLVESASDSNMPQAIADVYGEFGGKITPEKYMDVLNRVLSPRMPPYGAYPELLSQYLMGVTP